MSAVAENTNEQPDLVYLIWDYAGIGRDQLGHAVEFLSFLSAARPDQYARIQPTLTKALIAAEAAMEVLDAETGAYDMSDQADGDPSH